jgi:hypothetical protein
VNDEKFSFVNYLWRVLSIRSFHYEIVRCMPYEHKINLISNIKTTTASQPVQAHGACFDKIMQIFV